MINYIQSFFKGSPSPVDGVDCFIQEKGFAYKEVDLNAPELPRGQLRKLAQQCIASKIKLLLVYSDEVKKNPELIKAMIRHRLGVSTGIKVGARQCEVKPIDSKEAKEFFDKYHLDGNGGRHKGFGLFFEGEMVAAITTKTNFVKETEIARFAVNYNYVVSGAASKLIGAIGKRPLFTYSNNRLSMGDVYSSGGFRLVAENGQSYWYSDGEVKIWRFRCKRINTPEILKEFPTEIKQAQGGVFSQVIFGDSRPLHRVEDCGHRKWVLDE